MTAWRCRIHQCNYMSSTVSDLIHHQITDHEPFQCEICGVHTPAGALAILHVFEEHTRAEFLRAYSGDADDIRVRENVKSALLADSNRITLEENLAYRLPNQKENPGFIIAD